jgi:glycosyltransferase involved in cell wall biosynthesis
MGDEPAVELAGYLSAAVGVGEAARRYVSALRSAGVLVLERDVRLPGRDVLAAGPTGPAPAGRAIEFNLLCLNPEQMVPYLGGPEAPVVAGRRTIGIWSWEVDRVPPGWCEAAAEVAEIWTYSRFAAQLLGDAIGVPVVDIPPPLPETAPAGEDPLQLLAGFRVLVMFDYLSTLERKNPLGAVEAFRRAFRPDDGALLVLKSVNGRHRPEQREQLEAATKDRPDIVLVDRTMSSSERNGLIAGCDCYLSLHRSEGHGLPLAEAMAVAKPVVATAYGGNTEFMNDGNSYPVAWTASHVGEAVEHYPAGASWAEPDLARAAELLREVRQNPGEAERRGLRGQADVRALLAPEVVGARMRGRLEQLRTDADDVRGWRRLVPRGRSGGKR